MNMDIKNTKIPVASVTPVFDYQEPQISAKPATNTAAPALRNTVAPPPPESRKAVSDSDKKSAQTTLPGSSPRTESPTPEGIIVGKIVEKTDLDNAWLTAKKDSSENSSSKSQGLFKELTDVDNRTNEHWVSFTGAKVPTNADLEKYFATA